MSPRHWAHLPCRPRAGGRRLGLGFGRAGVGGPRSRHLADPLGSLLPHGDPFGEPGQVSARGNAQSRLERSAWPPAVSLVLLAKPEDHPGPFGERGVDVERFPARMAACRAGDVGADDGVGVRFAARDGLAWTVPLIERTF
jgi:hypothetical protein